MVLFQFVHFKLRNGERSGALKEEKQLGNKEYFKKKYASEVDFCVYDSYN